MSDLPADVIDEAERLTRLARNAVEDEEAAAYRDARSDALAEYDFTARIRSEDTGDVLVLHPEEWVGDGVIRTDRIEDIDRAAERSLEGPDDPDDWDAVDAHNRDVVDTIRENHDAVHVANATAFADFMSNHYAKRVDDATPEEITEFLTEYYPRNAWPSDQEKSVVETSVRLVFDAADTRPPTSSPIQ